MKFLLVILVALLTFVATKSILEKNQLESDYDSPYGYLRRVGMPLANHILEAETQAAMGNKSKNVMFERIVDGSGAHLGEIPYQAGLIVYVGDEKSICGGSLLNARRVLTAAHCWWDGKDQADSLTVVLGSVKLYSGGTRLRTSKVIVHGQYDPRDTPYDIAMIYLPRAVKFSNTIHPIALPSGPDTRRTFAGQTAIASGYGCTRKGFGNSRLYHVKLQVISNRQCARYYEVIRPVEICTDSIDFENICDGDSGGPLALIRGKKRILIGVVTFGMTDSLDGSPSGYTRVTAFIKWIKRFL